MNSELDPEYLNFVFSEASDVEFERFRFSARPVHIKLNLRHFKNPQMANSRLLQILGRAKLGLRSLSLQGQWDSRVLISARDRISDCRKYQLTSVVVGDTEIPKIFPSCMFRLQKLILDNLVFTCDRKFQLSFPTTSTLRRLHLAVRPVTVALQALNKLTAENVTLKFVTKKEDLDVTMDIFKNKFPIHLELDSLILCDLQLAEISELTSLTVTSAAILNERILKMETFPTGWANLWSESPSSGTAKTTSWKTC